MALDLNTFQVPAWTSVTYNIAHPYDLVFKLRADDTTISPTAAKAVWHEILKSTLSADDLKKVDSDDR